MTNKPSKTDPRFLPPPGVSPNAWTIKVAQEETIKRRERIKIEQDRLKNLQEDKLRTQKVRELAQKEKEAKLIAKEKERAERPPKPPKISIEADQYLKSKGVWAIKTDLASLISYVKYLEKQILANKNSFKLLSQKAITMEKLDWAGKHLANRIPEYRKILIKAAEEAFRINYDLDIPTWKSHLLSILNKDGILTVVPIISNILDDASVIINGCDTSINIEELAGTIGDYQNAVHYARSVVHGGYGKTYSGNFASRLWYKRLWMAGRTAGPGIFFTGVFKRTTHSRTVTDKNGKTRIIPITVKSERVGNQANPAKEEKLRTFYWDIMNARMQNMGSQAPYWYLLNYGSINFGDGHSGTAMPVLTPTFFVERAKFDISSQAYKDLSYRASPQFLEDQAKASQERMDLISKVESEILDLIDSLSGNISGRAYSKKFNAIVSILNTQWQSILIATDRNKDANLIIKDKIQLLANSILASVETGKRMYLATVEGKEYRRRTISLVQKVRQELQTLQLGDVTPADIAKAKKEMELIREKLILDQSGVTKNL